MSFYVYMITNKKVGKIYIGKTCDPKLRWYRHARGAARANPRTFIHRAMKKHGVENFSFLLIEEAASNQLAIEAEIFFIEYLKSIGAELYNLTKGGEGSLGFKHYQNGISQSTIAKQYGIARSNVEKIVRFETWNCIEEEK